MDQTESRGRGTLIVGIASVVLGMPGPFVGIAVVLVVFDWWVTRLGKPVGFGCSFGDGWAEI